MLRTERLLLRRFEPADVDDALAYRNDLEFARYLPHVPQPFTRRHAEAFVEQNRTEPWERYPTFAIVFEGHVIGTVSFGIEGTTAMVGYAIGRPWWGRGLVTEAARVAIEWAIETFSLERVWAATDVRNLASQRVLDKLGFHFESKRVHHDREGHEVDELVYGLRRRFMC